MNDKTSQAQPFIALQEIERRLKHYDKLLVFMQELAHWDATTDSYYSLFKNFQKRAKDALK